MKINQGANCLALDFNNRSPTFIATDTSKFKIARNISSNRLKLINNKIKLKDFNHLIVKKK